MNDNLVTLAIHTYQKAQILKTMLESEGIEVYLHNVNLIQPVVSAGVRVRIKESDLPFALKIIENSEFYKDDVEKKLAEVHSKEILIPIDFSDYSIHACVIGFNYAKEIAAKVVLLHAYYTPFFPTSISLNETFSSDIMSDEESILLQSEAEQELNKFSAFVKSKIKQKEWADVPFTTILRNGLAEEEIVSYSKKHKPVLIIMGTRGKNQKDIDLIGSVTAEVLELAKVPLFAVPEKTAITNFSEIERIAFGTSFEQKDLIVIDSLFKMFQSHNIEYYLFHVTNKQDDAWNEIKLAGIKEYLAKQYPKTVIQYKIIDGNDFIFNLENFIRTNKIDIISLSTHKRNIFTRIFNPSMARKMLFHTDTPLLVLHF